MTGLQRKKPMIRKAFKPSRSTLQRARKPLRATKPMRQRKGGSSRSAWIEKAQEAVNALAVFVDQGKPCICCGRWPDPSNPLEYFQAGHYRSVGSAPHLRFDLRNIHAQLSTCNVDKAGNHTAYRIGLIDRHGLRYVEDLEADNAPRKHTIEDLKSICAAAKADLARLQREAA